MNTDIYILNPEGNNGNGRITRYIGRGDGILARISLIDTLIEANRTAIRIVNEAENGGLEFADISEPAQVALQTQQTLRLQAISN
jgi:hypothetical protein